MSYFTVLHGAFYLSKKTPFPRCKKTPHNSVVKQTQEMMITLLQHIEMNVIRAVAAILNAFSCFKFTFAFLLNIGIKNTTGNFFMKGIFIFILSAACMHAHAQWSSSLQLPAGQSFADVSAPSDKNIWTITTGFTVYNTVNGGQSWNKIQPKGFGETGNISVSHLYAVNANTALLSVDSILTGVGPGFIYRTSDGGRNWVKVFTHKGNCDIKMCMFNDKAGLMSCSFSSFNGSVKSGQQLFYTKDGGNLWKSDTINPSNDIAIVSFAANGLQVGMSDFTNVYFSANAGRAWKKQKQEIYVAMLQFEDSSYAVGTDGFSTLRVKYPGRPWINSKDSIIQNGLISGLVLDGNECWIAEGLDKINNYYSQDSAKTFMPFTADSLQGFVMMTKARKGKTVIGITPPFAAPASVWINTRSAAAAFSVHPDKPLSNKADMRVPEMVY